LRGALNVHQVYVEHGRADSRGQGHPPG
jgi:hypothetical protein